MWCETIEYFTADQAIEAFYNLGYIRYKDLREGNSYLLFEISPAHNLITYKVKVLKVGVVHPNVGDPSIRISDRYRDDSYSVEHFLKSHYAYIQDKHFSSVWGLRYLV